MKLKHIILGLTCLASFSSCSDEMNYKEFTNNDKEYVFSTFDRAMSFVTDIYGRLDYDLGNLYNGGMLAAACDEAECAQSWAGIHDFNNGAWSAINAKAVMWANCYYAIRRTNFFLEECQGRTFSEYQYLKDYERLMQRYELHQYEVRFLRAYFYFTLVRQYGAVPFTTEVLTDEEANSLPRTEAGRIFDFIVDECEEIADRLPVNYDEYIDKQSGRATRGAVLALKARALLYQASPLFNTSGDKSLWQKAALANKEVLDYCSANGIVLGKYSALWGPDNWTNKEMLFMNRLADLNFLEVWNFPAGIEGGGALASCPTQTLVDAYEMQATGKRWNEEESGYNEKQPYSGRDPRFAMTIAKNGDEGWPTYNTLPLQTYIGGAHGLPLSGATPTSYYLKKYLDASVDLRPASANSKRHSWIVFRLGEFYLNYAEAVFNWLGSADATDATFTMSAREAVNKVRQRTDVQMPELPVGLTNAEFKEKYENERMVELAFESHRFWDVRRWKEGEKLKSVDVMEIHKNGDSYTYTRKTMRRVWDDKMYLFPIPDYEMRINPNLTQNPGW